MTTFRPSAAVVGEQDFSYEGDELALFAEANNWRSYWTSCLSPFVRGSVLEVGAGIGSVTRVMRRPGQEWIALEPDPALAERIRGVSDDAELRVVTGTLSDIPEDSRVDTILYIDVLEHIKDDRAELSAAVEHLNPSGRLVVLCPAHQWLFSEFDAAIGHHRRYSLAQLTAVGPSDVEVVRAGYLDAAGLFASGANRLLLRSSMPSPSQIRLWDTKLVPVSQRIDGFLGYRYGKSVFVIWQRS